MSVVVALAVLSASGAAGALGSGDEERQPPDVSTPESRLLAEKAKQEYELEQAKLSTPVAEQERRDSRTAYAGLDDDAAIEASRESFGGELIAPVMHGLPLEADQQVIDWLDDDSAIVTTGKEGERAVLEGTVPLRARDASGTPAPVDLRLTSQGGAFSPSNPLVPVSIPSHSHGLLEVGRRGVGARLSSSRPVDGVVRNNRVYYPNIDADLDAIALARPRGAEVMWVVRSPDAPEAQALELSLPEGVSARMASPVSGVEGSVELVANGSQIGGIRAPFAHDAQGRTVPADYALEGSRLEVRFPHANRDLAYPLLIDPVIDAWEFPGESWDPYSPVSPSIFAFGDCCVAGWKGYPGTGYQNGDYGEYYSYAPAGAYIYKAQLGNTGATANNSAEYAGIWSATRGAWEQGQFWSCQGAFGDPLGPGCAGGVGPASHYWGGNRSGAYETYEASAPTFDNVVVHGLHMYGGTAANGVHPSSWIDFAYLYLADKKTPSITSVEHSGYTGDGWNDGIDPSDAVYVEASVPSGLGMREVGTSATTDAVADCSGTHTSPCPLTYGDWLTYSSVMREGLNRVNAWARAVTGSLHTSYDRWSVKIDSSPPDAPSIGGDGWPPAGDAIPPGTRSVTVSATDGVSGGSSAQRRSGVKEVELRVWRVDDPRPAAPTDARSQTNPACGPNPGQTDSCPLNATLQYDTADYDSPDGATTRVKVEVLVRDFLEHERVPPPRTVTLAEPSGMAEEARRPPANASPPTISGTPREGEELVADEGAWSGGKPMSHDYQWRRCDAAGGSCQDIVGAKQERYTLGSADVGATVRVAVKATNAIGSAQADSAPSSAIDPPLPPSNLSPPRISGTAREGEALIAEKGRWQGSGSVSYEYRWRRCDSEGSGCAEIAGAATERYVPVEADIGSTLRVTVRAANAIGSGEAESSASEPVVPKLAPPASTASPKIAGKAREGEALSAEPGGWGGSEPIGFDYQWRRCDPAGENCADVAGAKAEVYVLTSADVGQTIRLLVTATNSKGSSQAASDPTAQVQALTAPTNTTAPTVHGTPRQGEELDVEEGTWSAFGPVVYEYRWRRCDASGEGCSDIEGATEDTYVLEAADVGATIRATVEATDATGAGETSSAPTGQIQPPLAPTASTSPTITGTARQGEVLGAETGAWTGTDPISYAYQWRRCDSQGAACAEIAGETQERYLLQDADVGKTIQVEVTATNVAGSGEALSATTAPVRARLTAPQNTVRPAISGDARQDELMSADEGEWSGSEPLAYAYQWRRCDQAGQSCADIEGAKGSSYVARATDAGATLRVSVTARNAAGEDEETSDATAIVESAAPPLDEGQVRNAVTSRVSVSSAGDHGNAPVDNDYWSARGSAISPDGGHVAFASYASNMIAWDANAEEDVFVHERLERRTTRASEGSANQFVGDGPFGSSPGEYESPDPSFAPAISADGRYVAFRGYAAGLTPFEYQYFDSWCGCFRNSYPASPQVFLRDRTTGATSLVSKSSSGQDGFLLGYGAYGESGGPSISADGRYVAFWSYDDSLDPDDGNGMPDYFVRDTKTGITERISVPSLAAVSGSGDAYGGTWAPAISADGRFVAFASESPDLVPGDTNATRDVFLHDRVTGATILVSRDGAGEEGNNWSAANSPPAISPDGALVAFDSYATNLDGPSPGQSCQLYVHVVGAGVTRRVSSAPGGAEADSCSYQPSISNDGRVAFTSDATNLVPGDANWSADAFVSDIATGATVRASVSGSDAEANSASYWPSISADGRFVSFQSDAFNLVPGDTNGVADVFVRNLRSALPDPGTRHGRCVVHSNECSYDYVSNTSPPTISGTPRAGEFLRVENGAWSGGPTTFDYQWRRCDQSGGSCANIAGAVVDRYLLTEQDIGSRIQVRVFASNLYWDGQADSVPTAQVQSGAASNSSLPTISGTAAEGEVLRGERGRWSGSEPIAYEERWLRCDPSGEACEEIPGARGESYALTANDIGRTIRFSVTARNAGGAREERSEPSGWVKGDGPCPDRLPALGEDLDVGFDLPCEVLPDPEPIYHAVQYEGDPAAGGVATAEEWLQLGTDNARREDFETITTRGIVPCPEDPVDGCGEVRYKTREGESDPTAADDFAITRGEGPYDPRLDVVADIAAPAQEDLSEADDIGSLATVLEPWQNAPPQSDGRFALYELWEEQWVDGEPVEAVDRLWIDFETELPIKQTRTVGDQTEQEIYYDYDPQLLDPGAAPADLFLATPPAKIDEQSAEILATQPELPGLGEILALPTEAERSAQALRFRETFGLSTDPALVASTLDDPALEPSIAEWGVPLTLSEQDEMAIRQELLAALPEIDAYAAQSAPDTYAGVWIDQAAGGIVRVGFTADAAAHAEAIKAFFPRPERLEGFSAQHTAAQLGALQEEIFADADDLAARGIDVREVGARVSTNSVEVGLPAPNPIDEQRLREIYGAAVEVIQAAPAPSGKKKDHNKNDNNKKNDNNHEKKKDPDKPKKHKNDDGGRGKDNDRGPNSREPQKNRPNGGKKPDGKNPGKDKPKKPNKPNKPDKPKHERSPENPRVTRAIPPLHGGLHIASGARECSSGYTIARRSGAERVYGVLTAGHCGAEGSAWRHPGWSQQAIGRLTTNLGRTQSTNSDVGEIRVSPTMRSGQIVLHRNHLLGFDGYLGPSQQYEGMPICLAGASQEGHRCGALWSPSVDVILPDGTKLEAQGKAWGLHAQPGDSGGPVYSAEAVSGAHKALGVQSLTNRQAHTADAADYFSQIQFTLGRLDAELVTTEQVPYFGFNEDWAARGWSPSDPNGPYVKAFAAGVDTNRFGVPWDAVQPTTEVVDGVPICAPLSDDPSQVVWPAYLVNAYQAMIDAGVRPVLVLSAAPPCRSQQTRCPTDKPISSAPPDPTELAERDWQRYAAAAAHRFDQALAFEIWNEPNVPKFWGRCPDGHQHGPSAARYVRLLEIAAHAIEAQRPKAPVVMGGLSPSHGGGKYWTGFLGNALDRGAASHVDAIALHPYRTGAEHRDNLDFVGAARNQLRTAREIRAGAGASEPFWVTEVGVATDARLEDAHKKVESNGPPAEREAEQAAQLAGLYRSLRDNGIPVLTFHKFVDGEGGDEELWDESVGVLHFNPDNDPNEPASFTPKVAYCALAQLRNRSAC